MKAMTSTLIRVGLVGLVVGFVGLNLWVMDYYRGASMDRPGTTVTQLPAWTKAHAVSQLIDLRRSLLKGRSGETLISDASDGVVVKFEAASLMGSPLYFFTNDMGPYRLNGGMNNVGDSWARLLGNSTFRKAMTHEADIRNELYTPRSYLTDTGSGTPRYDLLFVDPRIRRAELSPDDTLVLQSLNSTLLNHWKHPGTYNTSFSLRRFNSLHNYLILLPSQRSYIPPVSLVSVWRFEKDYFDPSKSQELIGRNLLFHIVNPSRRFRVVLDVSASEMGKGRTTIPPASVIGTTRVRFLGTGLRGAARLFSEPLSAQAVDDIPFIEIDMGRDGTAFPVRHYGLMNAYGKKFSFDYRRGVAYMRDVSVIPASALDSLPAPEKLLSFPESLENPYLEFAGLYEDGWMADRAVFWLSSPKRQTTLTLKAVVPLQAFRPSFFVSLDVDGKQVAFSRPRVTDLDLAISLRGDGRRHKVTIKAGPIFYLPDGDDRPATIRIRKLGFM